MSPLEIEEACREAYEERAAIIEHDGGYSRGLAEYEAAKSARTLRARLMKGVDDGTGNSGADGLPGMRAS